MSSDLPADTVVDLPASAGVSSARSLAGDSNSLPRASDFQEGRASSPLKPLDPPEDQPLWRHEADGRLPTRRQLFGPPLPDLTRIDQDRWRSVLAALPSRQRIAAALHPGLDTAGREISYELATSLPDSASEVAREALRDGPRLPSPTAASTARAGHQVNVRVSQDSYESLQVAARLLGGTPTQIARMLINNGVSRVLAEHDAAMTRVTSRHE